MRSLAGGLRRRGISLAVGLGAVLLAVGGFAGVSAWSENQKAETVKSTTARTISATKTTVPGCAHFKPLRSGDNPFGDWSGPLQAAYPAIYGGYVDDSAKPSGRVVVYETKADVCFEQRARETLPLTLQGNPVPVSFKTVPYSYATLDSARSHLTTELMNHPDCTVWGVGMNTTEVVIMAKDPNKAEACVQRSGIQIATTIQVSDTPRAD